MSFYSHKEKGRWRKYGEIILLSGCNTCDLVVPIDIIGPKQIPYFTVPFEYRYIYISKGLLYIVKPINMTDKLPSLILEN